MHTHTTEENGVKVSSRNIRASNHNVTKSDYLKQLILAMAKYGNLTELPYSIDTGSDRSFGESDAEKWFGVLNSSTSGQPGFLFVPKDKYRDFEFFVNKLDFRIFDEVAAQRISEKFKVGTPANKAVDIDPVILVENELRGED